MISVENIIQFPALKQKCFSNDRCKDSVYLISCQEAVQILTSESIKTSEWMQSVFLTSHQIHSSVFVDLRVYNSRKT